MELLQLNTSTLSDPNSLCIPFTSPHISDNSIPFPALINSGSFHCFINPKFSSQYLLSLTSIPHIKLKLIDRTISDSIINQTLELPVKFPSGKCMTISLFIFLPTPLVLGYNWLTCYNLLIDWVLGSTTFCPQLLEKLNLPPTSFARSAQLPLHQPLYSDTPPSSTPAPTVSIINFLHVFRSPGAQSFRILLSDTLVSGKSTSISDKSPKPSNLSAIPEQYDDFADVFSKSKAENLPPHWPYDLKINLEDGATPPWVWCIHFLNQNFKPLESSLMKTFALDSSDLIVLHMVPLSSLSAKKMVSLWLCIDYWGLNKITKKDRYPLLPISNLLSTAGKACIYTTLNLRHAYPLVWLMHLPLSNVSWMTSSRIFSMLLLLFISMTF